MTSQISPLHRGPTHFLNPSRDCSSFSIKDIHVKDVFGLSSYKGFNIGSCFVGSSTYLSRGFVFPNPRERNSKKRIVLKAPKIFSNSHFRSYVPLKFWSSQEHRNHWNGLPSSRERFPVTEYIYIYIYSHIDIIKINILLEK